MTVTSPSATRNAVVFLAVIAGGAALFWMRDILTPLALAAFLAVMIDSFARVMMARIPKLPQRVALPTAVVLSIVLFGLSVWVVAENSAGFVNQLKDYAPRLNDVIARIAHAVGIHVAPTLGELITQLNPSRYVGAAAQSLQNFAASAVLVLIYLGFIIASRRGSRARSWRCFRSAPSATGPWCCFTVSVTGSSSISGSRRSPA